MAVHPDKEYDISNVIEDLSEIAHDRRYWAAWYWLLRLHDLHAEYEWLVEEDSGD